MRITLEYTAQLKQAAGMAAEKIETQEGVTVVDVVRAAAARHGEEFQRVLFGESDRPHPAILLFVDDQQVNWDDSPTLKEGAVVSLVSPISGG